MLHLITEELAEVFHIHFVSLGVYYGGEAAQLYLIVVQILHRDDHVRQLADSRRLYQYPVRVILLHHFIQRLSKIAYKRAADASCYHLIDLYAGFSEESGIYSDLSEFVFYEDYVFCIIAFSDKFLDKRRFAGSEESGKNIYLCHFVTPHLFRLFR